VTAAAKTKWARVHKASGATVIERRSNGCKMTVIPSDWTRPEGAAVWSTSCGDHRSKNFQHKRGNASSVKRAKDAARRAAQSLSRRRARPAK